MRPYRKILFRDTSRVSVKAKKNSSDNSAVHAKDVFMPFITAVIVILFNQIFFEYNKRTESAIDIQKESLKLQTPILNRLLAFTYKFEISITTFFFIQEQELREVDEKGKIVATRKKRLYKQSDTVTISIPSFVISPKKRNRLMEDIETIKKQRDYLDNNIYVAFEDILDFLDENPLPDIKEPNKIINSSWKENKTRDKWNELTSKLRQLCYDKINYTNRPNYDKLW